MDKARTRIVRDCRPLPKLTANRTRENELVDNPALVDSSRWEVTEAVSEEQLIQSQDSSIPPEGWEVSVIAGGNCSMSRTRQLSTG